MQIPQNDVAASNSVQRRTSISDLPVELLLIIFDDFDFFELSSVASLHPYTQMVAGSMLKEKFDNKMCMISRKGLGILNDKSVLDHIGDMDVMFSTLKLFGHLMTNLTIDYESFTEWESGLINARISRYLGNSLLDFIVTNNKNEEIIFKHLTGPFKKVECLGFALGKVTSFEKDLNNVFPAVRSLYFSRIQDILPAAINHHYPNLIEVEEFANESETSHLAELFLLNPQILRIAIQKCDWNFLEIISDVLPNLEHLQIVYLIGNRIGSQMDVVHLPSVKYFVLSRMRGFPYRIKNGLPLVFGNLETLYDSTLDDHLECIMLQNKNLKEVILHRSIKYYMMKQIAQEIPYLEVFSTDLIIGSIHFVDDVVRFTETAKNLKRLNLRRCKPELQSVIFEKIQHDWEMVEEKEEEHVTFVRRQI